MTDTNIIALETATSVLNVMGSYDNYSMLLGDFDGGAMEAGGGIPDVIGTLVRLIETIIAKIINFVREKRGIKNIRVTTVKLEAIQAAMAHVGNEDKLVEKFDSIMEKFKTSGAKTVTTIVAANEFVGDLGNIKDALTRAKSSLKSMKVPSANGDNDGDRSAMKDAITSKRKYISCLNRMTTMCMNIIIGSAAIGDKVKKAEPTAKYVNLADRKGPKEPKAQSTFMPKNHSVSTGR